MYAGKQKYRCQTCGTTIPPYASYCDRHIEQGEAKHKPMLIDRLMKKILGR